MGSLTLGGIDLGRWTLSNGTFYRPPVEVRRSTVEVPGQHGEREVGQRIYNAPSVSLMFRPGGFVSESEMESAVDDLQGLLAQPGVVLRRTAGGRTVETPVSLVSMSPSDEFRWGSHAEVAAIFSAPGVFFRDPSFSVTGSLAVGGGRVVPWVSGTGPVSDAVVRFDPGITGMAQVFEASNASGIIWRGTSGAGTYTYVDCATLRAWRSTSANAWVHNDNDVSSGVDYPGRGPLQLQPVTGQGVQVLRTNLAPNPALAGANGTSLPWWAGGSGMVKQSGGGLWDTAYSDNIPLPAGSRVAIRVRLAPAPGATGPFTWGAQATSANGSFSTLRTDAPPITPDTGGEEQVHIFTVPAGDAGVRIRGRSGRALLQRVLVEVVDPGRSAGPYFDGATAANGDVRNRWTGAADNSTSEQYRTGLSRVATVNVSGVPATIRGKAAYL